jgi:hypothetical protein
MDWIQIALHVRKCSSKYGDDCFMRLNHYKNFDCYHSSSMGKFVYFAYGFIIVNS